MLEDYPLRCHICGDTKLELIVDDGMHELIYELKDGEQGEYIDSNESESGVPEEYIRCSKCNKIVYVQVCSFEKVS